MCRCHSPRRASGAALKGVLWIIGLLGVPAYYPVDGYGRPFQYTKGGHPDAVSENYDVWSYGDAPDGLAGGDLATKKDSQKTASWIKNW